jgi:hypothetical protein
MMKFLYWFHEGVCAVPHYILFILFITGFNIGMFIKLFSGMELYIWIIISVAWLVTFFVREYRYLGLKDNLKEYDEK